MSVENLYLFKRCEEVIRANEVFSENTLNPHELCLISNLSHMSEVIKKNLLCIFENNSCESNRNILYNEQIDLMLHNHFGSGIINNSINDVFSYFDIYYSLFVSFIKILHSSYVNVEFFYGIGFSYCKENMDEIEGSLKINNINTLSSIENNKKIYSEGLQWRVSYLRTELAKEYAIKEVRESDDFNQKLKLESDKLDEIKSILSKLENEVAKASLIKDFEEFIQTTNRKLNIARTIKWGLLVAILIIPLLSFASTFLFELNPTAVAMRTLSSVVVAVILGIMLRVSIRNEDQLEQIMHKVGNKTAVIYYYNANKEKLDGDKKEIEGKFYDFLFRDIETKEWNSPDVGQSIIDIIKAVKSN